MNQPKLYKHEICPINAINDICTSCDLAHIIELKFKEKYTRLVPGKNSSPLVVTNV